MMIIEMLVLFPYCVCCGSVVSVVVGLAYMPYCYFKARLLPSTYSYLLEVLLQHHLATLQKWDD
jgi:hypothetical protein